MIAYCINLERLAWQAHRTARAIREVTSSTVPVAAAAGRVGGSSGGSGWSETSGTGIVGEYIVQAFKDDVARISMLVAMLLALELWRTNVLFGAAAGGGSDNDDARDKVIVNHNNNNNNALSAIGGRREDDGLGLGRQTSGRGGGGLALTLASRIASNGNILRAAFILHVETTIVSLLSLIFYSGIPPELLGMGTGGGYDSCFSGRSNSRSRGGEGDDDDYMLSLIDYCARQLVFLGTPDEAQPALYRQRHPHPPLTHNNTRATTRLEELHTVAYDTAYKTSIACVSLARYICENINDLSPSLVRRILEVHDYPLLMVRLVEEPPWTRRRQILIVNEEEDADDGGRSSSFGGGGRRRSSVVWEKLDDDNAWTIVPPTDLLTLTRHEGEPWLALFHIISSKVGRETYVIDGYRKQRLLMLRKYIHDSLVDQLPVVADVARYLDELSIMGPPAGSGGGGEVSPILSMLSSRMSGGVALYQVDTLRESIAGGGGRRGGGGTKNVWCDVEYWDNIAQTQWNEVFSKVTDSTDDDLHRIAREVYGGDAVGDVMDDVIGRNTISSEEDKKVSSGTVMEEDSRLLLLLSRQIEKVVLQITEEDNSITTYKLIPVNNENGLNSGTTITDTPSGPYRRIQLSISRSTTEEEMMGDGGGGGEAIFPHAKVVCYVRYQNSQSSDVDDPEKNEVVLSINSLSLPTIVRHGDASSSDVYDEVGIELPTLAFPRSKEWRQLGDVEKEDCKSSVGVVLQLGFKRLLRGVVPAGSTLVRGYSLSQAYVSHPLVAKC